MQIIPDATDVDLTMVISAIIAGNAVAILSVLFIGVAVRFVVRWFNKASTAFFWKENSSGTGMNRRF